MQSATSTTQATAATAAEATATSATSLCAAHDELTRAVTDQHAAAAAVTESVTRMAGEASQAVTSFGSGQRAGLKQLNDEVCAVCV